jgi:hypothetical protein
MKNEFRPEYPGDNENREWVRKMQEKKGLKPDHRKIIMLLPASTVNILFDVIIRREFP